jgi:hypothetical protein
MVRSINLPALILEPVFVADFLAINRATDQRYLEARWKRPVSGEEFRQGMETIIESISEYIAELLLLDFRLTGTPSVSEQNWLVHYLASANQVSQLRRSARLFSKDLFQHIVNEVITEKMGWLPYEFRVFECETLAKQWLFSGAGSGYRKK